MAKMFCISCGSIFNSVKTIFRYENAPTSRNDASETTPRGTSPGSCPTGPLSVTRPFKNGSSYAAECIGLWNVSVVLNICKFEDVPETTPRGIAPRSHARGLIYKSEDPSRMGAAVQQNV